MRFTSQIKVLGMKASKGTLENGSFVGLVKEAHEEIRRFLSIYDQTV